MWLRHVKAVSSVARGLNSDAKTTDQNLSSFLVSEPLAMSWVFAEPLFEPEEAGEGRRARKHGCGNLLQELGLAHTPEQASARDSCRSKSHFVYVVSRNLYAGSLNLRACSTLWGVDPHFMVWRHRWGTGNRHLVCDRTTTVTWSSCKLSLQVHLPDCGCAESRTLKTVLLQAKRATAPGRPRHQPAQARNAEAVASCQKPAFGRQADHSQQWSACVVELCPLASFQKAFFVDIGRICSGPTPFLAESYSAANAGYKDCSELQMQAFLLAQ